MGQIGDAGSVNPAKDVTAVRCRSEMAYPQVTLGQSGFPPVLLQRKARKRVCATI